MSLVMSHSDKREGEQRKHSACGRPARDLACSSSVRQIDINIITQTLTLTLTHTPIEQSRALIDRNDDDLL